MIRRRKLALLVPLGAGIVLAGLLSLTVPPKYRAEALIKRQDPAILNSAPASLIARKSPGVSLNTLRVEILTWSNLDRVIRQLRLDVDLKSDADWQHKLNELRESITLETVVQTQSIDLIKIAAVSDSPKLAQRIANAIADNYVEESKRAGNKPTEDAIRFMGKGAEDALQELHDVEVELDKFRKERYAELPEVKKSMLDRRFALHTQQTSKALQLSSAQSRLIEIEKQMKDVPPRLSAPAAEKEAGESPGERMIINPVYQQLVQDGLGGRQEIKACEAALRQVQTEIGAIDENLRKVVNEEPRYTDLMRRQKELETTYSQYRQSQLAAEALHRATTGRYGTQVELIQRAIAPGTPCNNDQRSTLAFACLFWGLILSLVLTTLRELLDSSFQSVHKASAALSVPILGAIGALSATCSRRMVRRRTADNGRFARAMAISGSGGSSQDRPEPGRRAAGPATEEGPDRPAVPDFVQVLGGWELPASDIVMVHDPSGYTANEYRRLRAKLMGLKEGAPPRVITVSSAIRSDGKAGFALNLAVALREVAPGRVLVVGGDSLSPSLEELANMKAETGLTDILRHDLDLRGHVYETGVPGLDIIPVGHLMIAPELERSLHQGCGKLLEKLLPYYSFIIIDTPPVLMASHAATFGRHSDGMIVVAELGKTPRHVLATALDDVAASGVVVLGCVFIAPSRKRKG